MIATASAVVSADLQPVPIDVDCASGLLTSSILETVDLKSFGACMITQLNGIASDMDRVIQLLESANVPLVEDSAQGIGVRYKGTHVGGFGVGGCLSFYPAKVLGCLGDGGALITNNTALAEYALSVRDHGRGDDLQPIHWGRNSRLDSFQARVLLERMSHLPRYISHRREIASIYNSKLSFLAKNQLLTLPPSTSLGSTDESVYQNYEILASNRDLLQEHLKSVGVGTIKQWGGFGIPHLSNLGFNIDQYPQSYDQFNKLLLLPMNHMLTPEQAIYISDSIIDFYS